MALENLFKVVTTRFNGNTEKTDQKPVNSNNIPDDLLFKCPRCRNVVFEDEYRALNMVCPKCGYHGRITASERIELTVDKGSFIETNGSMLSKNPINFPDYDEKQQALRDKTGLSDAIVTGEATIRGIPVVIGVMDSRYMMASMGSVVGEKLYVPLNWQHKRKTYYSVYSVRWRKNAGRYRFSDADGKDFRCSGKTQRSRSALYNGSHRPHYRRRDSVFRISGRYNNSRTKGSCRLCRTPCNRRYNKAKTSR